MFCACWYIAIWIRTCKLAPGAGSTLTGSGVNNVTCARFAGRGRIKSWIANACAVFLGISISVACEKIRMFAPRACCASCAVCAIAVGQRIAKSTARVNVGMFTVRTGRFDAVCARPVCLCSATPEARGCICELAIEPDGTSLAAGANAIVCRGSKPTARVLIRVLAPFACVTSSAFHACAISAGSPDALALATFNASFARARTVRGYCPLAIACSCIGILAVRVPVWLVAEDGVCMGLIQDRLSVNKAEGGDIRGGDKDYDQESTNLSIRATHLKGRL